jgi:hypothetical protein
MAAAKTFLKYPYCTPRLVDNLSAVCHLGEAIAKPATRQLGNEQFAASVKRLILRMRMSPGNRALEPVIAPKQLGTDNKARSAENAL